MFIYFNHQNLTTTKITKEEITPCLADLGDQRRQDTVAEYKNLCPQLAEVMSAFANSREEFNTRELYHLIQNKIIEHVPVDIAGKGKVGVRDVAELLFFVGFITAKRSHDNGKYEHYSFSQNPTLFQSRSNPDQGMTWEIHPVFRQSLGLRDEMGRVTRRQDGREL